MLFALPIVTVLLPDTVVVFLSEMIIKKMPDRMVACHATFSHPKTKASESHAICYPMRPGFEIYVFDRICRICGI